MRLGGKPGAEQQEQGLFPDTVAMTRCTSPAYSTPTPPLEGNVHPDTGAEPVGEGAGQKDPAGHQGRHVANRAPGRQVSPLRRVRAGGELTAASLPWGRIAPFENPLMQGTAQPQGHPIGSAPSRPAPVSADFLCGCISHLSVPSS